jgi:CheY-like chemotaxis protein
MNKRILIVDDETNVHLNFRTTLETEGYEIFESRSGEEAVQSLAEHPFALAILDIRSVDLVDRVDCEFCGGDGRGSGQGGSESFA